MVSIYDAFLFDCCFSRFYSLVKLSNMGRTKRRYKGELLRFRKTLKRPLRNVLATMPEGFSEEHFCQSSNSYILTSGMIFAVKQKEYNRMDKGREKKGFPKIYFFPKPISICDLLLFPLFITRDYTINLRSQRRSELSLRKNYLSRIYASKKIEKIK